MKIENIPIKEIKLSSYQCRQEIDSGGIEELGDSIKSEGIINPLTVRKNGKGAYELVCGQRRFLALKRNKEKEVPCVVRDVTDGQVRRLCIAENLSRKDLTPMERSESIAEWVDSYMLDHCEDYLPFIKAELAKEKEGAKLKHNFDLAKPKHRLCYLLTLRRSDEIHKTKVVVHTCMHNCDDAFAKLPGTKLKWQSYASNDLAFVMDLDEAREVLKIHKEKKLSKAKVKALLKLKKASLDPKDKRRERHAARYKAIIETGTVDGLTSNNEPSGETFNIEDRKVTSRHIFPPKPRNKSRMGKPIEGALPRQGLGIAKAILESLSRLDEQDQEFEAAIKEIKSQIEEKIQIHNTIKNAKARKENQ